MVGWAMPRPICPCLMGVGFLTPLLELVFAIANP